MKLKIIIPLALIALVGVGLGLRAVTNKNTSPAAMHMTPAGPSQAPQAANEVYIQNYKFNPSPLKVKKGTTVTWTNKDLARHNIAVDDGQPAGGPTGPLFGQNETFQFTFNTVGTYKYHCEPHPYMHGEVEVTE